MKKTIIHETLELNYYKKTKSAITGDQLGAELFAKWKVAVDNFRREAYKYRSAKRVNAGLGEDAVPYDATPAFNALQVILDLVGEVNGHCIVKNGDMLEILTETAIKDTEALAGEALTIASELANAKKRLKALDYNGVNPEAVTQTVELIAELEEKLRVAKAQTGSCTPGTDRATETTFRKNFEKKFYKVVVEKQALKTWEELEAEKEERRKARREATKAKKAQAKSAK